MVVQAAVGFVFGAVSTGLFLPCNKASLHTYALRGLVGAGIQFLSMRVALLCATYFVRPAQDESDKARYKNSCGRVGLLSWALSGAVFSAVMKVALDRLNQPIRAREMGVHFASSVVVNFLVMALKPS
jgi:hypothetical protein